jgi:hypothetical protein
VVEPEGSRDAGNIEDFGSTSQGLYETLHLVPLCHVVGRPAAHTAAKSDVCATVEDHGLVTQEELLVAGYVLVIPAARPPDQERVLPAQLLTISDCLMADLPRPEFWDWFVDLEVAEQERAARAPKSEIVAVAMDPGDARAFMREQGGPEQPYFELLRTGQRVPASATVLGYEVVGAEWTLDFHSWHCHSYALDVARELGVRVNRYGLIDTYENAVRVLDWMMNLPPEEQPEPVEWTVVGLTRV